MCSENHKKLCSGKGYFGYKCLTCDKFNYPSRNETTEDIKNRHICWSKFCPKCFTSYEDKDDQYHQCLLRKEEPSKNWPHLAFLHIELMAKIDKEPLTSYDTNIVLVYVENKIKRGQFDRKVFSHFKELQKFHDETILNFPYWSLSECPLSNERNGAQKVPNAIIRKLTKKIEVDKKLINEFLLELCNEKWSGTTFLLQDEDSLKMVSYNAYNFSQILILEMDSSIKRFEKLIVYLFLSEFYSRIFTR